MNPPIARRLGAACGGLFAVVLVVAAGNGDQSYAAPREVAGLVALTLFIPFVAYLSSVLRAGGWLASAALAGGVTGIGLKIVSGIPEVALQSAHVADGTALHRLGESFADAATVIALYPLAILCAATAVIALRTGVLPRWLGGAAAVTAVALAVNGAFLTTSDVPALLLFLAWTLAASLHLLRTDAALERVPRSSVAARS